MALRKPPQERERAYKVSDYFRLRSRGDEVEVEFKWHGETTYSSTPGLHGREEVEQLHEYLEAWLKYDKSQ